MIVEAFELKWVLCVGKYIYLVDSNGHVDLDVNGDERNPIYYSLRLLWLILLLNCNSFYLCMTSIVFYIKFTL